MNLKDVPIKRQMELYFDCLWPICRSLMGPGFRRSLKILEEIIPLRKLRFATGENVFDWTVPKEWNARDAYLIDPFGKKRAAFKTNNLHLVNYSAPFRGRMPLEKLREHLHSLPDLPDAIPYLTSYYKERWGFCLTHNELKSLPEGMYNVVVDTSLISGNLIVGEAVLPGESRKEVLFSTYLCHPSLADNELSGPLVMAFLYKKICAMKKRHWTYRFVVAPETLGAVCYLTRRGDHLKGNLIAGYQITCVGDSGNFTYKRSRRGDSIADRVAIEVLKKNGKHSILPFDPSNGSDERQYCSPGFNLPVGSLMRTMYGCYPEYHTSLDNKDFICFNAMEKSLEIYFKLVQTLEGCDLWENTVRNGEPQLGKRKLYPSLGSQKTIDPQVSAMLWCLNLADGTRDIGAIAERAGLPFQTIAKTVTRLANAGLLEKK
jgi:aminopeptidase-like protein